MKKIKFIPGAITLLVIALFLYAAINKLWDYDKFQTQLTNSPYTKDYAHILAWAIPSSEIAIAGLLLFYKTRLAGMYGAFLLMLAFTIYIYVLLHFSSYVPCACGGILSKLSWQQHFWFNVLFTLLSAIGVCTLPFQRSTFSKT